MQRKGGRAYEKYSWWQSKRMSTEADTSRKDKNTQPFAWLLSRPLK